MPECDVPVFPVLLVYFFRSRAARVLLFLYIVTYIPDTNHRALLFQGTSERGRLLTRPPTAMFLRSIPCGELLSRRFVCRKLIHLT